MSSHDDQCFAVWWRDLERDPAGRSALRRCGDIVSVMMVPAFHRLWWRARDCGFSNANRVAVAAAVLAHVRTNSAGSDSFPKTLASILSEKRFRRALTIEDTGELLIEMVRFVRFNRGTAPVESLGRDIHWWSDRVKRRWALEYYESGRTNR